MQWKLESDNGSERHYINQQTGNELTTKKIYTDGSGATWWGFHDLLTVPYIRQAFSKAINNLFQCGLQPSDLKTWLQTFKTNLKLPASDVEKYEKCYSKVLEMENQINNVVDPLKQNLALATIYVLGDKERIDYFNYEEATKKLELWQTDIDAQTFFLNWLIGRISVYSTTLNNLSQIVLRKDMPQQQNQS